MSVSGITKHGGLLSLLLLFSAAWYLVPHPLVILVVCAAPLGAIFVIRHTFPIILLFVVFSFFRLHEVFPQLYNFKIPLLLSLASLMALAWHTILSPDVKIFWAKELSVASVFFVLVIVGVVMASNRGVAIEYFTSVYWKIMLMMYAIAWLTRSVNDFRLASVLITLSGIGVGIVAIKNKLSGIGLVEETRVTIGRELGSVLGDPNDLALVLMFPMAFATSLVVTPGLNRWLRLLGILGIPILFFAIISTQSRGGLLGILAVFAVFAWRKIKSKVLLFSLGFVLSLLLFVFAGISDRKSGGAAEEGIDASAQGRLYAWEAAVGMAVDNPVLGVGLHNFYSNYYFYSPHWDGLNHAVHSTWFGVLAETGMLGFAIFVYFIVLLFRSCSRSLQSISGLVSIPDDEKAVMMANSQAIQGALIGTVVSGTFLTHGFTWPIYILAGLVVALSRWTDCQNAKRD